MFGVNGLPGLVATGNDLSVYVLNDECADGRTGWFYRCNGE